MPNLPSHTYVQNDFHYTLPGRYVSILRITSKLLNPGAFFVAVTGRRWSQISWRCLGAWKCDSSLFLDYLLNSNSNSKITNTYICHIITYLLSFIFWYYYHIVFAFLLRCDYSQLPSIITNASCQEINCASCTSWWSPVDGGHPATSRGLPFGQDSLPPCQRWHRGSWHPSRCGGQIHTGCWHGTTGAAWTQEENETRGCLQQKTSMAIENSLRTPRNYIYYNRWYRKSLEIRLDDLSCRRKMCYVVQIKLHHVQ